MAAELRPRPPSGRLQGQGAASPEGSAPGGPSDACDWTCDPDCPVRRLDEQAGERGGGFGVRGGGGWVYRPEASFRGDMRVVGFGDSGGPSRFFFCGDWNAETEERLSGVDPVRYVPKASRGEKEAGLDGFDPELFGQSGGARARLTSGESEYLQGHIGLNRIKAVRNPHPTVKPISLCTWLAKLLLPPPGYAPRRILVPFAGTGSEMVGALLAGWDEVVGVEIEERYCQIAEARLQFWVRKPFQISMDFDRR